MKVVKSTVIDVKAENHLAHCENCAAFFTGGPTSASGRTAGNTEGIGGGLPPLHFRQLPIEIRAEPADTSAHPTQSPPCKSPAWTSRESSSLKSGSTSPQDGIDALLATTRDIPDYDVLMTQRLRILDEHGLKIGDIQEVIETLGPLEGALEFLDWLKSEFRW